MLSMIGAISSQKGLGTPDTISTETLDGVQSSLLEYSNTRAFPFVPSKDVLIESLSLSFGGSDTKGSAMEFLIIDSITNTAILQHRLKEPPNSAYISETISNINKVLKRNRRYFMLFRMLVNGNQGRIQTKINPSRNSNGDALLTSANNLVEFNMEKGVYAVYSQSLDYRTWTFEGAYIGNVFPFTMSIKL